MEGHQKEGDADEEELVGDGEVDDVGVGDGVHLGVAGDSVDDEGVTEDADEEDEAVEDLD